MNDGFDDDRSPSVGDQGLMTLVVVLAVGLVVIWAVLFGPGHAVHPETAPLLESLAALQRTHPPPDVADARPEVVVSFLQHRLGHRIDPMAFDEPTVTLVGGRVSHVADQPAAVLYYEVDERPLSVVVFEKSNVDFTTQSATVGGREVRYALHGGYVVPTRPHGDLTYALIGDVDRDEILRLAARARWR